MERVERAAAPARAGTAKKPPTGAAPKKTKAKAGKPPKSKTQAVPFGSPASDGCGLLSALARRGGRRAVTLLTCAQGADGQEKEEEEEASRHCCRCARAAQAAVAAACLGRHERRVSWAPREWSARRAVLTAERALARQQTVSDIQAARRVLVEPPDTPAHPEGELHWPRLSRSVSFNSAPTPAYPSSEEELLPSRFKQRQRSDTSAGSSDTNAPRRTLSATSSPPMHAGPPAMSYLRAATFQVTRSRCFSLPDR